MAVQQGIAPRSGPRQHWVRRIGGTTNLVCSIIFAIMGGLSIGWLFSTLDFLGVYQPVLTVLASVGFTFFGFNQSRDLASRIYAKEPWKASLCGLVVYEFVEVSACLFEAAHGVRTMVWLSDFTGVVYDIFFVLLLVVLSVLPVFNIFCGLTDVRLHREKHGQSAPVVPPVQPSQSQLKPAAPG